MNERERAALIERVTGAWRPRDPATGGVRAHPAWHDLPPADRRAANEAAGLMRVLEAALDPDGLSTTARAVLARIPEEE